MRAEENKKREAELQSIENFYRDKFEILAEDMKVQKEKNKLAEREHLRKISSAKSGLTKRLEEEIKEMQSCIIKGNDFYVSGCRGFIIKRGMRLPDGHLIRIPCGYVV